MLQRKDNSIFCPDCGRSWHFMEGLSTGDACPSDDCPSNENTPLGVVNAVCKDFDCNGIYSIGAIGALRAMAHHWKDHFAEGHNPKIISKDIDEMKDQLEVMRAEIMRRLLEPRNPNLIPYRVMLHEDPGDKFQIVFDCQAEDDDHAVEQAENAYPGCEIMTYLPFDRLPLDFVVYSPNESALGAGFWSNEDGWVDLPQATRFTKEETERLNLPMATGQDARLVLWEEANEIYDAEIHRVMMEADFARSEAIKAEYLASGCQASDVDEAVRKLMAECGELFADDHAAWGFLMEETHEERELTVYQEEIGSVIDCMLQDGARGQTMVFIREGGDLIPLVIPAGNIDLENLEQYEMILFDGGNSAGDTWKHVFFPRQQKECFVDENPLPRASQASCDIDVSLDGGETWQSAPQGVRIVYKNVMIDGEEGRGEVHLNATHEGLITDIWTRREPPLVSDAPYDHNIGTDSILIDEIVSRLVAEND